jgi:hypothetical protein
VAPHAPPVVITHAEAAPCGWSGTCCTGAALPSRCRSWHPTPLTAEPTSWSRPLGTAPISVLPPPAASMQGCEPAPRGFVCFAAEDPRNADAHRRDRSRRAVCEHIAHRLGVGRGGVPARSPHRVLASPRNIRYWRRRARAPRKPAGDPPGCRRGASRCGDTARCITAIS